MIERYNATIPGNAILLLEVDNGVPNHFVQKLKSVGAKVLSKSAFLLPSGTSLGETIASDLEFLDVGDSAILISGFRGDKKIIIYGKSKM